MSKENRRAQSTPQNTLAVEASEETKAMLDEKERAAAAKRIPSRYNIVNGYQRVDIYDDEDGEARAK